MRKSTCAALVVMVSVLFSPFSQAGQAWESYKARFFMPDGRIVDTGNGSVSHTEGQGFAMLMAVENDDKATFDKLWQWTNSTLKNKDNGLFYWRYNPVEANPITDKNNATDGDVMIAWALLKADARWHDKRYSTASDEIAKALLTHNVIRYAGYRVMLPGANGFNLNSEVVLNPSYFVFPAWQAFADRSHLQVWRELIQDGQRLLGKMGSGKANLPTDWVSLDAGGKLTPAKAWPPRMSYDAIRIPLYVHWFNQQSLLLTPWRSWFGQFSREKTPAWVNVTTNEYAPYMMEGGLLAVRDLTMGQSPGEPDITAKDDYYSASLKMLVWLSEQ
ncbi:endoglucanase [Enterobacter sp. RHBSTW-00994]|uniref:glycosyl hydrolase family 8 n=1 Tax=Enterobacter sp. RHBSTW-00994 TaxID=2742676 RepID=UPI0015E908DE|nr:glycosyl hydrolase family 8 [Enterobacter sp. RHBSTW-00994]QLR45176.1 endoglucanase [Enterobacter sp. RHBSTW-00994]